MIKTPIVAIVGHPNVGKSTLFNKIAGQRTAIATNEPGVTRDLNIVDVEERGVTFTMVDTGGFEADPTEEMDRKVKEQTLVAIEDADLIVFLMDARTGPTLVDGELVSVLRRSGKSVIYAANKVDTPAQEPLLGEFYGLGLDRVMPLSSEHGGGVYELLTVIVEKLSNRGALNTHTSEEQDDDEEPGHEARTTRVAIVGRPNVGKSSLLNSMLKEQRAIVSNVAGTTRNIVDTPLEVDSKHYLLIDTAGIRNKQKISHKVEIYCVMQAIKAIERCDVALLVIDAVQGMSTQDERIAGLIQDHGKSCIIVVNKWDAIEKDTHSTNKYTEDIKNAVPFIPFAPLCFVSAKSGQRVEGILKTVDEVSTNSALRVQTSKLNKLFESIKGSHQHPLYKGREVKFYYATQTGIRPPTFVVFTNRPVGIDETYKRYLIRRLREGLDLQNVPLRVFFRARH